MPNPAHSELSAWSRSSWIDPRSTCEWKGGEGKAKEGGEQKGPPSFFSTQFHKGWLTSCSETRPRPVKDGEEPSSGRETERAYSSWYRYRPRMTPSEAKKLRSVKQFAFSTCPEQAARKRQWLSVQCVWSGKIRAKAHNQECASVRASERACE